jgi:hypothetical protein
MQIQGWWHIAIHGLGAPEARLEADCEEGEKQANDKQHTKMDIRNPLLSLSVG